jgi:hypothetical protein
VFDISNLLIVLLAFGLSLIVPTLRTALWLSKEKSWPNILLIALVIGLTSQGVLGFFWNHFLRDGIYLEITIYLLFWLIITVILSFFQKKPSSSSNPLMIKEDYYLITLIILAVAVRSIHPIQHMALGQSDAYSHLQFLRNVVDTGFVQNVMYPPGYHWILALPTAAFHLDPYLVARYGGAFFGAGLVLAAYVFVKSIARQPAPIFSAFLVSCFPGLYLLQKAGVGAFANQMGLFFIPAVFYFYIMTEENNFREAPIAYALLALSLMGLSVSVPMMLIHVLLILCIVRMSMFMSDRKKWFSQTGVLACLVLPAVILLSLHLIHAGPVHQEKTIELITAGASTNSGLSLSEKSTGTVPFHLEDVTGFLKSISNYPVLSLAFDFFSIKRWGIDSVAANSIGVLILVIFGICMWCGFIGKRIGWVMLGFWGIIASVQTLTGFLQFSGYQREGWSLLIVVASLSGIFCGAIYRWGRKWVVFKGVVFTAILLSILGSFLYPPVHELRASCAEDEIIRVVRDISQRYTDPGYLSIPERLVIGDQAFKAILSSHLPLTIMTRKMTGWHDYNQGELVPTVIHPSKKIQVITISSEVPKGFILKTNRQYLVLMDNKTEGCFKDNITFSMFTSQQKTYVNDRESYFKINESLESYLDSLNPDDWQILKSVVNRNLIVISITPVMI